MLFPNGIVDLARKINIGSDNVGTSNHLRSVSVLAVVAAASLTGGPALCQTQPQTTSPQAASDQTSSVGEVVVTAQKRSENVQKVPTEVTVVGSSALVARGVGDLRGLTSFLPMAELDMENTTTQVFIRGIGQTTDADTDSPAVATNIDGVYTPRFTLGSALFDIDHVEVLSGPQGTLYGRNAAGGAVNVFTKLPSDHFESDGFIEGGNYGAVHMAAGVNVPVTPDFYLRGAFDYDAHQGYLTNGQGDLNTIAGRIIGVYKPKGPFSMIVRAEYEHDGGKGSSIILSPLLKPDSPWYQPNIPGANYFNRERVFKINGEIKYDFGGEQNITLTYIPAYTEYTFSYNIPIGEPVNYYPNPGVAGSPLTGFSGELHVYPDTGRQVTNELRLSGGDDHWKWVAGLYQLNISTSTQGGTSFNIYNPGAFFGGPITPLLFQSGGGDNFQHVTNASYAVFGQTSYSLTDRFRITGGLRYSYDDDHTNGLAQSFVPIAGIALPAVNYNLSQTHRHVDWRIGAEYDLTPSSMAYANVETGYIDGGFNVVAASASATTFRPENLVSYTLGVKNRFLENSLQLNFEGFYYDYRDLQVSAYDISTGSNILYNVPKSRIYGVQVDGIYKLARNTTFDFNLGYLHAEIVSGMLPPVAIFSCGVPGAIPANLCSAGQLVNYAGQSLPNAPTFSGSLGLTQRWNLPNDGFVEGRAATHFETATWGLFAHLSGLEKPAYTKTDLSITYHEPKDRWSLGLWVRNVENTAHLVTPATTSAYGLNAWFIDPPRTYGVRAAYQF